MTGDNDEPVEIIQPGETGKISGITNASENPMKVYPTSGKRGNYFCIINAFIKKPPEEADTYNWTAEELAIIRRGGSVPVVVNGTVFQARMPQDAQR
jgi:hypothetical protein